MLVNGKGIAVLTFVAFSLVVSAGKRGRDRGLEIQLSRSSETPSFLPIPQVKRRKVDVKDFYFATSKLAAKIKDGSADMKELNVLKVVDHLRSDFDEITASSLFGILKNRDIDYQKYSKFFATLADLTIKQVERELHRCTFRSMANILISLKDRNEPQMVAVFKVIRNAYLREPRLAQQSDAWNLVSALNAIAMNAYFDDDISATTTTTTTTKTTTKTITTDESMEIYQVINILAGEIGRVVKSMRPNAIGIALNSLSKVPSSGKVKEAIIILASSLSDSENLLQISPTAFTMAFNCLSKATDLDPSIDNLMEKLIVFVSRKCHLWELPQIESSLSSMSRIIGKPSAKKTIIVVARILGQKLKNQSFKRPEFSIPSVLNSLAKVIEYKEIENLVLQLVARSNLSRIVKDMNEQGLALTLNCLAKVSSTREIISAMFILAREIPRVVSSMNEQGISNAIGALSKLCTMKTGKSSREALLESVALLAKEAAWNSNTMNTMQMTHVFQAILKCQINDADILHRLTDSMERLSRSMNAMDYSLTLNALSKLSGENVRRTMDAVVRETYRVAPFLNGNEIALTLSSLAKYHWSGDVREAVSLLSQKYVLAKIDDMDKHDLVNTVYGLSRTSQEQVPHRLIRFIVNEKIMPILKIEGNQENNDVGYLESLVSSLLRFKDHVFENEITTLESLIIMKCRQVRDSRSVVSLIYLSYREIVTNGGGHYDFRQLLDVLIDTLTSNFQYKDLDLISKRKLRNIFLYELKSPILDKKLTVLPSVQTTIPKSLSSSLSSFLKFDSEVNDDVYVDKFSHCSTSRLQNDVYRVAKSIDGTLQSEITCKETGYTIDIGDLSRKIGIEVNGPSHFSSDGQSPDSNTIFKRKLLELYGWRLFSVSHFVWNNIGVEERKRLLGSFLLQKSGGRKRINRDNFKLIRSFLGK